MTYYRPRIPEWLWAGIAGTVVLAAIAFGLYKGAQWIRQDERAQITTEADATRPIIWPVQYARLTRERDSLREVIVVRDSQAGASAAASRASIARLRTLLAAMPTTQYDTILVAAATETANLCTVATNDCDSVRAANARLQFVKDSVASADSTANARLLLTVVTQTRTIGDLTNDLRRRPTWGTVTKTCTAATALGAVGGLLLAR